MAEAARIAEDWGYAEVNVNVGCPSDRVQSGRFGACLMREPETVAQVVEAMRAAVSIPVTVKCRIGVDDQDPETALDALVDRVVDAGCATIIVHARKAWLQGLSPKENRDIPPLDYPLAVAQKARRPELEIVVNGGVASLDAAEGFLAQGVDGVMIGRAAWHDPGAVLAAADRRIFGEPGPDATPDAAARAMIDYAEEAMARGERLHRVLRPMLGLFAGRKGARRWRQVLSSASTRADAGPELIEEALAAVAPAHAA